jgi:hypothetical protein
MKKKIIMLLILILLSFELNLYVNQKIKIITKTKITNSIKKWNKLILAFIWVESKGNDKIEGEGNAVGCLQITPVYVKAVNGILKRKGNKIQYTLEDRKSRKKSIEMFNVLQLQLNPNKNIRKAIKLHNPGSSEKYYKKIIQNMK